MGDVQGAWCEVINNTSNETQVWDQFEAFNDLQFDRIFGEGKAQGLSYILLRVCEKRHLLVKIKKCNYYPLLMNDTNSKDFL